MRNLTLAMVLTALAPQVQADEISDAITAAGEAYAAGDLNGTATALQSASSAVANQRSAALAAFLPDTVEGWTVEADPTFAEGMAMMGGGVGAMKRYSREDGTQISISVMVGGQLMLGMMEMFKTPEMLAMMGTTHEIQGLTFVDQGNSLMGLVGSNTLVQAEGGPADLIKPLMEQVNLKGMAEAMP